MPVDVGNIEMYMGPAELGAPDDLEAAICRFIDDARDELDVAVQELESEAITRALTDAKARGIRVRVILERAYLNAASPPDDPFGAGGDNDANRTMLSALLRAGIQVAIDLNPAIFHQKFIVRDPDGPSERAAVLTGSTNFTPTGLHQNLNHIVVVRGRRTSGVYEAEFEEMWNGTFGRLRERHDPTPAEYSPSKVRVKVLFAPEHAPEMEIMKQMLKATDRVDFAMFTFTDSSGIDDTMRAAAAQGVHVRGVLDRGQGNQTWAATYGLRDIDGIDLFLSANGKQEGGAILNKLHHKLAVIDDIVVIAGSFNFTLPATNLNDENILVIGSRYAEDPDSIARQRELALFARAEIDRMIDELAFPT